jgi:hypothetical protein
LKEQLKDRLREEKRIKNLVEKYKTILSLNQERISIKEGTEYYESEIGRNEEENEWVIQYKEGIEAYYVAHELGHLHLAKKCRFMGFVTPMKENAEIDWNIQNNCLLYDY